MTILMKSTNGYRRAHLISAEDAEKMVKEGDARKCEPYDIYEEITDAEKAQGYATRNMEALPLVTKRKPGRPPKAPVAENPADASDAED